MLFIHLTTIGYDVLEYARSW